MNTGEPARRRAGKRVLDELYLHVSALDCLDDTLKEVVQTARTCLSSEAASLMNVVKVHLKSGRVSFLAYGDFDTSPFPTLESAWSVSASGGVRYRCFEKSANPPVLHRKELLVRDDHPQRASWEAVTATAESLGLFESSVSIGFRLNWERLILSKGYELSGSEFVPLGNARPDVELLQVGPEQVQRHLTALSRSALSAPVQLLIRHGLLRKDKTLFDYGCGRGGDMASLSTDGFAVGGWDPYFLPEGPIQQADVVNLGFVINVIEEPAERVQALRHAFGLARGVLSVGVMLYGDTAPPGRPYGDGFLTSRNTFQKYFSQIELKEYLEHVLGQEAFLAGPGVAFVFSDKEVEQRFCANRYRRQGLGSRSLLVQWRKAPKRTRPADTQADHTIRAQVPRLRKLSAIEQLLERARPQLDALWSLALDLGRIPEADEVPFLLDLEKAVGSLSKSARLLAKHYDRSLLATSASARADDLRVYFAMQHFAKRPPYKSLERRLQLDIRAAFGDYKSAQQSGLRLLSEAAEPEKIFEACRTASTHGLGWLDEDHSLQLHVSLVERLPPVLRVYVGCGLQLYGALGEADLVKVHVRSGKLSLLEFDNFFGSPIPRMTKRVKVNLRELDYDVFSYNSPEYPPPILYRKSRYMHEDMEGFAEQQAFDQSLEAAIDLGENGFGPPPHELLAELEAKRLAIEGFRLVRSGSVPNIDSPCGEHLTYRDVIECGETWLRLRIPNLPRNPATYNALYDLATQLLDPIIDYYGSIRLTYGFCSSELGRHIHARVAPHLDQHAAEELDRFGKMICARGGAACDFIVDDEDMYEVAEWIIESLPFDRLYFYGSERPLHLSFSHAPARLAFAMVPNSRGHSTPRPFSRPKR